MVLSPRHFANEVALQYQSKYSRSSADSPPIKQEPNDNDAEGQETIDLDRDLMQE